MAYLVINGNEFKLTLWSHLRDQVAMNTIRCKANIVTNLNLTDTNAVAYLSGQLAPSLKALMTSSANYDGASLHRVVGSGLTPLTKYSNSASGAGTAGSDPLPLQTAGIISWRTAQAGRKNRGRMYIPFPDEADNAGDGIPVAGYKTRLETFMNLILGTLTQTVAADTIIWSFGLHPATLIWEDFESGLAHRVWATQRRRGSYGASNKNPFA